MVLGHPDLSVARLSEEHTIITSNGRTGLKVGDRIVIIPAHACTVVNLHPAVLSVSQEPHWILVDARGWRN